MAHVEPLTDEQIPAEAQPVTDAIRQNLGQVLNIFRTMAYQPAILEGVTKVDSGIQKDLPGKLRELAYLKASLVNQCHY